MLTDAPRLLLLLLLATASPWLSGCTRSAAPASCGSSADGSVAACVDGAAITAKQVEPFVEESWWVPGSATLPDARKQAVERAIRTKLFELEARRRKLPLAAGAPDAPASWAQALLADEAQKRGLVRDAVTDDEATREYEGNKELFNQVDQVHTQVIVLATPEQAEKLHPEAAKADEGRFAALAAEHSIDAKTKGAGGERLVLASSDEDRVVLKMALSLRKPGAVGGPFKGGDGRWYLMRIKSVPLEHVKPLEPLLRLTVKNAIVDRRRKQLADELAGTLRARARVEVFDNALANVTVPAAKAH